MTPPRRTAGRLALLAAFAAGLASVALAGCGYTVGNAFRAEVRTVSVPLFGNESFRRGLEHQLTAAVTREIQLRTPFQIASEGAADTRLVGKIVRADKLPINFTPFDDPRALELNLALEIRWEDLRTGQALAYQTIPIAPDAVHLIATADFSPETGQSRATAEQDAVNILARQVVDLMETPW